MATKRINFATINEDSIATLSKFNQAHYELKKLREEYKAKTNTLEVKINDVRNKRSEAISGGMSADDAIRQFPLEELIEEQNKAKNEYDAARKPHNDAQRECLEWVDENLYYGYLLSQKTGSFKSKGSVGIKFNKDGSVKESIMLNNSYYDMIKDFLEVIGCSKTDDPTALSKFVNTMAVRTSGMVKANKGDDYVKTKTATQYRTLYILNFLQFLVKERGLLVESEDHTLEVRVFE